MVYFLSRINGLGAESLKQAWDVKVFLVRVIVVE